MEATTAKDSGKYEEWLWNWFHRQERYTIQQFGIGIVGIGALFFAYAQATFAFLKILIALIGLGGSVTLVMHMYGARMTRNAIFEKLQGQNGWCSERKEIIDARNKKINRFYYPPASMMIYYMVLVSFAWIGVIGYRLSIILQPSLSDEVRLGGVGLFGIFSILVVFYLAVQQNKTQE